MSDHLQFDLVSPERRLASIHATAVRIPGSEGDMTAMPDHMPVITTLRPGLVVVEGPEGTREYVVSGGFAEITPTSVSVLAERSLPRDEVTAEFLDELERDVEATESTPETADAIAKTLADLVALRGEIQIPSTARAPAPA